MKIGNILGSRKARQIAAAVVAIGVVQVPLVTMADAPAPWVQKADQKKKKKKAARKAARRPVQQVETVTRAPEAPPAVAEAPPPPPPAPAPVPVVEVAPPPVPAPPPPVQTVATTVAKKGGMGWLFGAIGLGGLAALLAAMGNDSNG